MRRSRDFLHWCGWDSPAGPFGGALMSLGMNAGFAWMVSLAFGKQAGGVALLAGWAFLVILGAHAVIARLRAAYRTAHR